MKNRFVMGDRSFAEAKRMLQQHRCGERIDVTFASFRASTELAHGTQGGRRREAFVQEAHGKTGSLLELRRDMPHLRRALGIRTFSIEGQPDDEAACLERFRPSDDLRDGGTLARASDDVAGW
jgi:hypothetical protein